MWIIENFDQLIMIALAVVGAAAAIATVTPTQTDNKIVDAVYKVLHTLAMNFGKAKNDPAKKL